MEIAARLLEGTAYVVTAAYAAALVLVVLRRRWEHPLLRALEAHGGKLLVLAAAAATAGGMIASRSLDATVLLAATFAVAAIAVCAVGEIRGARSGPARWADAASFVAVLPFVVALGY